jgi:hypothetical protein
MAVKSLVLTFTFLGATAVASSLGLGCSPINPSVNKSLLAGGGEASSDSPAPEMIVEPISTGEAAVFPERLSSDELSSLVEDESSRDKLLKLLTSRSVRDPKARHWLSEHQVYNRKSVRGAGAVSEDYRLYRVSLVLLEDGRYELLLKVGAQLNRVRDYFRQKGRWKLEENHRLVMTPAEESSVRFRVAVGVDGDDSAALFLRFQEDFEISVGGETQEIDLKDKVIPLRYAPAKRDENL